MHTPPNPYFCDINLNFSFVTSSTGALHTRAPQRSRPRTRHSQLPLQLTDSTVEHLLAHSFDCRESARMRCSSAYLRERGDLEPKSGDDARGGGRTCLRSPSGGAATARRRRRACGPTRNLLRGCNQGVSSNSILDHCTISAVNTAPPLTTTAPLTRRSHYALVAPSHDNFQGRCAAVRSGTETQHQTASSQGTTFF